MEKKVLVTGAGGFLGSNLVKYLSENTDFRIFSIGLNNLRRERFPREIYFQKDLLSSEIRPEITNSIDWVFDFASVVGGFKFLNSQSALIMNKATMMNLNVLEASRKAGVKKILFASSACVYPRNKNTFIEEDAYPIDPENSYGLQKIFMENVYREYQKTYGIEVYLPRFQNIYGPFIQFKGEKAKGLADICRKVILAKEEIELFGDGNQVRDYTYSEDAMEGVWKLINSDIHEPINISSGEAVTIDEYARKIIYVLGKNIKINYTMKKDTGVNYRVSSNTKARKFLDWIPSTPLEKGIKKMTDWIKEEMKI
jgi:GDP-D-mannose 3',5'-epimerase